VERDGENGVIADIFSASGGWTVTDEGRRLRAYQGNVWRGDVELVPGSGLLVSMPRMGYAESQYRVRSVLEGLVSIGVPCGQLPALIAMTCINCGLLQPSANHCQSCLWSLHLPPVPAPVSALGGTDWTDCRGPMRPVNVTKDEVTHRCDKCGQASSASLADPASVPLTSTSADDGAALRGQPATKAPKSAPRLSQRNWRVRRTRSPGTP
jgi:hypothetical protein